MTSHVFNREQPYNSVLWKELAVTMLLLAGLVASIAPSHNWDLIAYVALTQSWGESDTDPLFKPERIHTATWRVLQAELPGETVRRLQGRSRLASSDSRASDRDNYRQAVASEPLVLVAQLPFYSVKPLYPAAMFVLTQAGVLPVAASVIVTRIGWVLMGCFLFAIIRLRLHFLPALACVALFMHLPMVRALASYSTPDALCSALILGGLFFSLNMQSRSSGIFCQLCVVLAVVARPDSLLFVGPVLLWFVARDVKYWPRAILVATVTLVCCVLQKQISGNYGWLVLFVHSFVDYLHFPGDMRVELSLPEIMATYLSQISVTRQFWGFTVLASAIGLIRVRWLGAHDRWFCGLAVVVVFMITHWFLFPGEKDRMMIACYLFVLAAAAHLVADWRHLGVQSAAMNARPEGRLGEVTRLNPKQGTAVNDIEVVGTGNRRSPERLSSDSVRLR